MTEEWRDIPGWEGFYQASSFGRVMSLPRVVERSASCRTDSHPMQVRGGIRIQWRKPDGRMAVTLSRESIHTTLHVSVLVMAAFAGPRPEGMEVCHRDDDPSNNHVSNLYYGTHIENCADRDRNGGTRRGETSYNARLSEAQIKAIRNAAWLLTGRQLAWIYGVTPPHISVILSGKRWGHIEGGKSARKWNRRGPAEVVHRAS